MAEPTCKIHKRIQNASDIPDVQPDSQHVLVYGGVQHVLNDPGTSYLKKVEAIITAWNRLYFLSRRQSNISNTLMDKIIQDSFTIITMKKAEWKMLSSIMKNHILFILHQCVISFNSNPLLGQNFNRFLGQNFNPNFWVEALFYSAQSNWGSDFWERIILEQSVSRDDMQEAVMMTSSCELKSNLEFINKMMEKKTGRVLASFVLEMLLTVNSNLSNKTTSTYKVQLLRLSLVILYDDNAMYKDLVLKVLNSLNINETLQIVKQLMQANDVPDLTNNKMLAFLCVTYTLPYYICENNCEAAFCDSAVAELASQWISVQQKIGIPLIDMCKQTQNLASKACSNESIYALCNILYENPEVCKELRESFVHRIMLALNEDFDKYETLEKQEKESPQYIAAKKLLSFGLYQLSKLFNYGSLINRECILSSFSVHPTPDKYSHIKRIAQKLIVLQEAGSDYKADTFEFELHVEALAELKLLPETIEDLRLLVNSARCSLLYWSLPWHQLNTLCRKCLFNSRSTCEMKNEEKKEEICHKCINKWLDHCK